MKTRSESHRLVKALVAAALLLVTIGVSAPTREIAARPQTDPRFEELAALVTEKMAEYRVPGVAFGIVKDGRVQSRGFGVTNLDNPQPVTSDTIFTVASISKTLVATALMRLVEAGQLDLEAPVRSYLPDFKVQDETATRDVRIWNLMTHTPGWEGQLGAPDRGALSLAAFMESMEDLPQLAPSGALWSYDNAGFALSGRVIEVVTDKSIHEALREGKDIPTRFHVIETPQHVAVLLDVLRQVHNHALNPWASGGRLRTSGTLRRTDWPSDIASAAGRRWSFGHSRVGRASRREASR